ncbi:Pectate lyase superfamily protein [Micromonospora sediminicola]|uniref:Pectate lyase superfamily protein n=1 Tax=Micromonospora sediminicola TaxID=946078 RepID=A0A1A9B9E4_9ACTN|nr:glycosyl hydrolase family 28-related protein [Micromonospora sediminicola]SBT65763.1 Pectate lyase superfamily protein [Micromonospora sediminicola]
MYRRSLLRALAATPLAAAVPAGTVLGTASPAAAAPWRSSLYPTGWTPGYRQNPADSAKFLHDFSYAGYHEGRDPIPTNPSWASRVYDVRTRFGAVGDGVADDTVPIQKALDAAAADGGGTVYLPAGTYRVSPQGSNPYTLWLHSSRTILKGAGSSSTRIYNAASVMRDPGAAFGKNVIRVGPVANRLAWDDWWYGAETNVKAVTAAVGHQATVLPVANTAGLAVGDWIVVRCSVTDQFIADHAMTGYWDQAVVDGQRVAGGLVFYRRITAKTATSVTVDIPLRYRLLPSWNPRIYTVSSHLGEVGVQGISIGMRQNTTPGTGDEQFDEPGTGAYQMHDASVISMDRVVYGWVRDVKTFRPQGNTADVHILSKGIELVETRNVTLQDVYVAKPQYKGAGGNGYLVQFVNAQENLLTSSTIDHGRHNVTFDRMGSSGNVVHDSTLRFGRLPSDFHRYLSPSNLWDSITFDGDCLNAVNRGHASLHAGHTTSQSVFWNVTGGAASPASRYLIETAQHGYGYVMGTSSTGTGYHTVTTVAVTFTPGSNPQPTDVVEGVGAGATLEPRSLYADQLARRLG